MRAERVVANYTCNQNCTYCASRAARDERAFVLPDAVRGRVAAALARGAREVVLTGGEPALRRDLADLVAFARARGAERVVLETNATELDAVRAAALRDAGLTLARVNLAGWGPRLDAVTRDPGGFERTLAGLRALVAQGVAVEVASAVVRSTRALLPDLPARLADALRPDGRVDALVVTVPTRAPDDRELLSYPDAAAVVSALDVAARAVGVPARLAPGSGPPPCVFASQLRAAHLFALTPGAARRPDHRAVDACARCAVADRCPGFPEEYLARFGAPPVAPVTQDNVRRRLSVISTVQAQVARELVSPNRYQDATHGDLDEDIVRVNFHCNQACRFCFVSTHLPPAGDAAVRAAITEAARRGHKITLSGGEPTLNPELVSYVKLAKGLSRYPVQLQTNATRLDDALARALDDAGLDEAFVSLHASTAAVSDAITAAPGTFEKSVVGIDHLARTRVKLILNYVLCEANQGDLPGYVRMVAARWPRAMVNVSFVAPSTDVVPRDRAFVPRYADVLPALGAALEEAARLGVEVCGFESMCGIPLCLVPASLDRFASLSEIPAGFDRGEFQKTAACGACALETRCYGLRRGYAELHGTSELRPITRA